jgi:hypothetical protein
MPEFQLDHGAPCGPIQWESLDSFTQGYLEALFFTESDPAHDSEDFELHTGRDERDNWEGSIPNDAAFADIAPSALKAICEDCDRFQRRAGDSIPADRQTEAGRDFWYTRNGHGVGFWDGDWPEPSAGHLDQLAKAFGEVWAYWSDDGRVWL